MALPGWGTFAGGIGAFLGKLSTFIPGRIEKLKNEKLNLTIERKRLIGSKYSEKNSQRVLWIDNRIDAINRMFDSKISD